MAANRLWFPDQGDREIDDIFDIAYVAQQDIFLAQNYAAKRDVARQMLCDLGAAQCDLKLDDIEVESGETLFPIGHDTPSVPTSINITISGRFGGIKLVNIKRQGIDDIAVGVSIEDAEVTIPQDHPDFVIPKRSGPFPVSLISRSQAIWY